MAVAQKERLLGKEMRCPNCDQITSGIDSCEWCRYPLLKGSEAIRRKAEKMVVKEAARGKAQEAQQAKLAEKRAKKEVKLVAKAEAKRKALEARKARDAEKLAKNEAKPASQQEGAEQLQDAGFSVKALAEFDDRTRAIAIRHHIAVSELKDRLLHELECLDEGLGLETLIQSRQAELGEREQATAAAKKELESLKTVIGSLKQEKASLEATIKETREKVSIEMAKITAAARDMINTLAEELRRGHDEALAEVRRLKDEAVEVGKEVGRYEEMIQANQWLSELLALARGEESIEGKRVRVIALLILRGAAAWLKHNEVNNLAVSTMSFTLENLIREVEQWKV